MVGRRAVPWPGIRSVPRIPTRTITATVSPPGPAIMVPIIAIPMAPTISPIIPVIAIAVMAMPIIPMIVTMMPVTVAVPMMAVTVALPRSCDDRLTCRQGECCSGCEIGQSPFHWTLR